jgi:hypothetical protein
MKSVIFFGSSNTFGVGLHTFRDVYLTESGIKTITFPYLENGDDKKFIKQKRWTNLVAKFLKQNEINISEVGGSPAATLYNLNNTDLSEIDYIFFEFSGIYNYFDRYFHSNHEYPKTPHEIELFLTSGKNDRPELKQRILKWLDEYNPNEFIDEVLILLKEKIEQLNDKKFIILFWHDAVHLSNRKINFDLEKYSWLKKYMIKFPTKEDKDNYIVHNFILENNLRICDEHPLSYLMKEDIHAGIKGNEMVAEIVINYINEKETTNSWR